MHDTLRTYLYRVEGKQQQFHSVSTRETEDVFGQLSSYRLTTFMIRAVGSSVVIVFEYTKDANANRYDGQRNESTEEQDQQSTGAIVSENGVVA